MTQPNNTQLRFGNCSESHPTFPDYFCSLSRWTFTSWVMHLRLCPALCCLKAL